MCNFVAICYYSKTLITTQSSGFFKQIVPTIVVDSSDWPTTFVT